MNRRPHRLPFFRTLCLLSALLVVSGCTVVRRVLQVDAKSPATVSVLNQTDYDWKVVLTSPAIAAPIELRLVPRATRDLQVMPGDYAIEQTLVGEGGDAVMTRTLTARFYGGESYRWPLMTLLSNPSEPAP